MRASGMKGDQDKMDAKIPPLPVAHAYTIQNKAIPQKSRQVQSNSEAVSALYEFPTDQ